MLEIFASVSRESIYDFLERNVKAGFVSDKILEIANEPNLNIHGFLYGPGVIIPHEVERRFDCLESDVAKSEMSFRILALLESTNNISRTVQYLKREQAKGLDRKIEQALVNLFSVCPRLYFRQLINEIPNGLPADLATKMFTSFGCVIESVYGCLKEECNIDVRVPGKSVYGPESFGFLIEQLLVAVIRENKFKSN